MGSFGRPLPPGRAFEKEVFGVTDESLPDAIFHPPSKRGFKRSLQDVIQENWAAFSEAVELGETEYHNPSNPELGKTGDIWRAVKRHLPRRTRGSSSMPLQLFVAIGKKAFDWRHGVDAVFLWYGVIVTIDASLRSKDKDGKLKADFVLNPRDLAPEALDVFGKRVADLLKQRRRFSRTERVRKKRVEILEQDLG